MATQEYRIVAADDSEIYTEPHIRGSRLTVRFVHELVEKADVKSERVAEKYNVDIADVYEALSYYHSNPAEMHEVEHHHQEVVKEIERRPSVTPPATSE